ncbi:MAG: hypothetical protein Q8N54_06900 [Sulfurimicrobium sp.]|nr:hypothetical protein [Sulfurimicrobium sp.]
MSHKSWPSLFDMAGETQGAPRICNAQERLVPLAARTAHGAHIVRIMAALAFDHLLDNDHASLLGFQL